MKVQLNLTATEAAEIILAAASANGHAAETVTFVDETGKPIDIGGVYVRCDSATMRVRCAPESDLSSMIRQRQEYAMSMLNQTVKGKVDAEGDL